MAIPAEKRYYPITVARSDGTPTLRMNGSLIQNEPKQIEQQGTNVKGYTAKFVHLKETDPKAYQWKRKLAGMLVNVLDDSMHKRGSKHFVLAEFPHGYVLWEQQKTKIPDSVAALKAGSKITKARPLSKNERAAPQVRNDAFLFGYPRGKMKRFRSPVEFFPHLLWLVTDSTGDYDNCSCKFCNPDRRKDGSAQDDDKDGESDEDEARTSLTQSKQPSVSAATAISQGTTISQGTGSGIGRASAGTTIQKLSTPSIVKPTAPAQATQSREQESDARTDNIFLYRAGELAWYNKGQNWGLCVVTHRQQSPDGKPAYFLQPLSHPLHNAAPVVQGSDTLRPWLAWSAPPPTHKQLEGLTFDQVPWARVIKGEFGEGNVEVDGSILAAKSIDTSYTLIEPSNVPSLPGETHYNGIFIGAEKVWAGEPVRIVSQPGDSIVMIIKNIIERTTVNPPTVVLTGDIYKFVSMPSTYSDPSQWRVPDLPPRMIADLRYRNEVAFAAKNNQQYYEWRLLEPAAKKALQSVKGRWYESRMLMPILRSPEEVLEEIHQGLTSDCGAWLNNRGGMMLADGIRKETRLQAFVGAVPKDLKIDAGLNA